MKTEHLLQTAAIVVDGAELLKPAMSWETCAAHSALMGAILAEMNGLVVNPEKYTECKKLLKKKVSFFSGLRGGNSDVCIAVKMMNQADPEAYLEKLKFILTQLKELKAWSTSPYSVLALMTLADHSDDYNLVENINRYDSLYKILHSNHPFMVNDRDRGVLAMLAVNGITAEEANAAVEANYTACKDLASNNDAAYTLAEILSLSRVTASRNAENVEKIMELLKLSARKVDKADSLAYYGVLSLLDDCLLEELVLAICEVDDYLAQQKYFKGVDIDKKNRILYAALIVLMTYPAEGGQNAIVNETLIRALLEQTVLAAIEAAQAAAAAAAAT